MAEKLIIGLSDSSDHAQWLLVGDGGEQSGVLQHGTLENLSAIAGERTVWVVLHDMQVIRSHCQLPVSGNKLVQALPYALEDQFAEDVELLHFAAGAADEKGVRPVATISRQALDDYLARLLDAGIRPTAVYTSHDALTPLSGFVQLLVGDDRVILRAPDGSYAGLEQVSPYDVFEAWRASSPDAAEAATVRVYCDESARQRYSDDFQSLGNSAADLDIKLLADGWLAFTARAVVGGHGINLLQGRYARKSDALAGLRPWLAAAALLAVAVLLGLVERAVDYRELNQESVALDREIAGLLATVQNGGGDLSNAEAQLAALLNRQRRGSTSDTAAGPDVQFLDTLAVFAGAAVDNKATKVEAIAYRNGVFDIRLTTPDTSSLEALTQQVARAPALDARIQRTESQDSAVKSFVQISRTSP